METFSSQETYLANLSFTAHTVLTGMYVVYYVNIQCKTCPASILKCFLQMLHVKFDLQQLLSIAEGNNSSLDHNALRILGLGSLISIYLLVGSLR